MHNQLLDKHVARTPGAARAIDLVRTVEPVRVASPPKGATLGGDLCVKPFKLSKFTSRQEPKTSVSRPVKLKLWGNAD